MKNLIILLIFFYVFLLYGSGENFPFGINNSVYEKFHSLTEDEEYKSKYKATMDQAAQAGLRWWRVQYAFRWCDVEATEGIWDFETEDSLVKWTKERGLHLLPVIGYTADWATDPNAASLSDEDKLIYPPNPDYWDEYETYISTLVERYKEDIKYWQFLNEPYGARFLGTPEQYAEMYKHTWEALKSADSTAKIVGLCMTSLDGTFEWKYFNTITNEITDTNLGSWQNAVSSLIESIGLDSIDVVSHHIYNTQENFMKYTRELNSLLKEYTGGEDKPIWITETGFLHADEVKAGRGENEPCSASPIPSFVTYSSGTGDVFRDSVNAKWKETMNCVDTIIRTFLSIEDTVILIYRTNNYGKDTIIYNGGPLIYTDTVDTIVALDIGDTLKVFDCWAQEIEKTHNPDSQAVNYRKLFDSIINTPNFLDELKIFFYCVDNTIHRLYYPPQIEFGNRPDETTYTPIRYARQRKHAVYSIIDTTGEPYEAYGVLQHRMDQISNIKLQNVQIGADSTEFFKAYYSITTGDSSSYFVIDSCGEVTMTAGNYIYLVPGYEAKKGSEFYASIDTLLEGGNTSEGSFSKFLTISTKKPKKAVKMPDENTNDSIPKVFSCAQNYPNPFAGNTTIKYGLPKDSKVNLCIYNLIGQKVKTLVDAEQSAGYKSVTWDGRTSTGKEAPKGVYFYTFEAGDFEKHHKMILLK